MSDMTISKDIIHIGASDKNIKIFESQYVLENGMSYNSYLIKDEKNVVLDTIDEKLTDVWLTNLEKALDGEKPDYLIVSHMEPDHAYNIGELAKKYPEMKIVGNQLTFNMLANFFKEMDFSNRKFVVMEGDVIHMSVSTNGNPTPVSDCTQGLSFSLRTSGEYRLIVDATLTYSRGK